MTKRESKIEYIRHSLAHILAMAVLEKWPGAKLGVGPVIETGCYYDFDFNVEERGLDAERRGLDAEQRGFDADQRRISGTNQRTSERKPALTEADLPDIERRMKKIISQNLKFSGRQVSFQEARKFFREKNQPYKIDLINDLGSYGTTEVREHIKKSKFETPKNPFLSNERRGPTGQIRNSKLKTVGLYKTGDFVDLCRGGHVANTRELNPNAFRVTKIAGAYWRGSDKNPMLTRVYVAAFRTKKELDQYLVQQEEAVKRDHRKLGESLDLFTFSPLVGPGLPLYTPRGAMLRKLVQEYVNDLQKETGYQEVWSPQIAKAELFKTSGHYEKFKGDMFRVSSNYSNEEMFLKPMNCPGHTQIYASKPRSWRDLPIRYADSAMLYRDEKPGELLGLSRVRAFSQDDAHVFCREDQVEDELNRALKLVKTVMKTYGLKHWIRLSLHDPARPEKYLGDKKTWQKSEKLLEDFLKKKKIAYKRAVGEAAFYGPKMDLMVEDSLAREWQLSTIQVDTHMPARFGLTYTDKDGTKKTPVMIHRAINGSAERFLALIIEHYVGAFPVWLAPVQAAVIPVSEKFHSYAHDVGKKLKAENIRSEVWDQNESIGKKIREGELQKIPYLLVVGEKEKRANAIAVRERGKGDRGAMPLDKFIKRVLGLISARS